LEEVPDFRNWERATKEEMGKDCMGFLKGNPSKKNGKSVRGRQCTSQAGGENTVLVWGGKGKRVNWAF